MAAQTLCPLADRNSEQQLQDIMWDWFSLPRNGTELLQAWEGTGVSSHAEEHWLS